MPIIMSILGVITANTKHVYNILQRRPNVFDAGPTLYKCYTNVLRLLGMPKGSNLVEQYCDNAAAGYSAGTIQNESLIFTSIYFVNIFII